MIDGPDLSIILDAVAAELRQILPTAVQQALDRVSPDRAVPSFRAGTVFDVADDLAQVNVDGDDVSVVTSSVIVGLAPVVGDRVLTVFVNQTNYTLGTLGGG